MRNVDIRVINGYEFDLNTYTEEARKEAIYLFEEYGHFSKQLNELKDRFSAVWLFEESSRYEDYQLEKKKLQWVVNNFEHKLLELDKDYRNKRGLSYKKFSYYVSEFVINEWFPVLLTMVYLSLAVYDISRSASPANLIFDFTMTGLMLFHSRKKLSELTRSVLV
ncbi:hypothetical protein ACFU1R_06465 [Priestia megaterium]|uniref:hypothetical protein n=1 Tax=Priestia megaterium TaxID=1404 RepID=UPI00366FCB61